MALETAQRHTLVLIARVPVEGVASFQEYESAVLPLLSEFGGLLERRLRNSDGTVEVHIVSFDLSRALKIQKRSEACFACASPGEVVSEE